MRFRSPSAGALAVIVLAATTACASIPPTPHVSESAPRDVSAFTGSTSAPSPEATITPAPGSWDAAPGTAVRATLLAIDGDDDGEVVVSAAQAWARDGGADLDVVRVRDLDALDRAVVDAADAATEVIIGAGPRVVDALALSSPQFLDQQFLLVGAQLAEPTGNVTAVIWPGAGFRGTGITADGADVPGSITMPRVREALSAGLASIQWDLTGIVIQLP